MFAESKLSVLCSELETESKSIYATLFSQTYLFHHFSSCCSAGRLLHFLDI
jgi:hypothetical protein